MAKTGSATAKPRDGGSGRKNGTGAAGANTPARTSPVTQRKATAKSPPAPKTLPAHEIVAALFAVVTEEARRNEAFARRLLSVYPEAIVARLEKPQKRTSSFDAAAYHAINILRAHGEAMLRGRLSSIRSKAQLKQIATRSGLKLTGPAARRSASIAVMIEGIVEAAQTYEAQRAAALK